MSRIFRLLSLRTGASLALGGCMLVALLLVFWIAWGKWGPALTNNEKYLLELESISVTEPPPWIHVDVKSTVYRDGSLAELSMLDRKLAVKVAKAFELNPWVERVKWVRKGYPSQVVVELEYRRPVAMVEVQSQNQMGLFPVDAHAVLLNPRDFSENMTLEFLRIRTDYRYPIGAVGSAWGDRRITEAAAIANRLQSTNWRDIGIHRIVSTGAFDPEGKQPTDFYLLTKDGLKIHWGRAPDAERGGEPDSSIKIAWLEELYRAKGPLSKQIVRGDLDLRHADRIKVVAPARQPELRPTSGQ